jgi:capsular exopolysaccharide synthesis family protein
MPQPAHDEKIDIRMYIGILIFRWKLIVVCFLWSILIGVLYIQLYPPKFRTHCTMMIYRDPNLQLSSESSPWASFNAHAFLLENEDMRKRAAMGLMEKWSGSFRNQQEMILPVTVDRSRKLGSTIEISVESRTPQYAEDFLSALLEEHKTEWNTIQKTSSEKASEMLQEELDRLEDKIKRAENDLIDYLRLHDTMRTDAKSTMESRYLTALMERKSQLTTELMLLEAQYPNLESASPSVISQVSRLTLETGSVEAAPEAVEPEKAGEDEVLRPAYSERKPSLPKELTDKAQPDNEEALKGWQELKVKLAELRQREQELAKVFEPNHQQYKAMLAQIKEIEEQLKIASQTEMSKLRDRHDALTIQLKALEQAEYKWKANNLLASQRKAELNRISDVVDRFESNYDTLYSRLHDMKVSEELKAEHFHPVEQVTTNETPVWPDPLKVLLMALAIGLGSGFGIALLMQTMDNKIQTITDVEGFLGVPFIGGVPYWLHGGLEKSIRPIVTEENSTGAVEAYRALRTNLLASLAKLNENLLIVTSADSREGKTLTVLNLAILVAQMGKRVLLVDMDLRRGRLHRSLGLEREPGMTDVLKDGKPVSSVVVETRIENLFFAPSGSSLENTAELLQSADVSGMLQELKDEYDYIFIDTSPVLRVTDTVIVASQGIGAVAFVSRVNHTPKPMVKYALDMLSDCRILGLIMNSIEMHRLSSLYYAYQYPNYAYYANAYAYGYDYYYYGDGQGKKHARKRKSVFERKQQQLMQWLRRTLLPMD